MSFHIVLAPYIQYTSVQHSELSPSWNESKVEEKLHYSPSFLSTLSPFFALWGAVKSASRSMNCSDSNQQEYEDKFHTNNFLCFKTSHTLSSYPPFLFLSLSLQKVLAHAVLSLLWLPPSLSHRQRTSPNLRFVPISFCWHKY